MPKSEHSIFSFFSGAGFLDLGFELNGFDVVFANEVHKPFAQAYEYSRKGLGLPSPEFGLHVDSIEHYLSGEKSKLVSDWIKQLKRAGKTIGFIGGPPCPDFSVAGKNQGRQGENGKLSRTYIDLVIQKKPDFFVFENVKGLYRTKKHREFFEELKNDLQKAGYDLTERLVNSLEFGAPQDRERIILFGVQKNSFQETFVFDWTKFQRFHVKKKSRLDIEITPIQATPISTGIPQELTVQHWFDKNAVATHANARHQFVPRAGLTKFQTIKEGDDSKKSYKRLSRFRFSPTVAYGNNEVHIHPVKPRRISVAEALALQSLPKAFTLPPDMTLSNMFKTIGNGVPFALSEALAKSIHYHLELLKNAPNRKQLSSQHTKAA